MTPRPFRFGTHVGGLVSKAELLDTARSAEDLGYAVFGVNDHLDEQLAPLIALTAAAAATSTIGLQPLVLANDFRHPAMLAKEAATLDLLSGGRFSLALGAGWLGTDFRSSGIRMRRPGVRVDRVAEAIEVITGLLGGEPFDFHGTHYEISEMTGAPAPHRSPMPLMVAGSGRRLLSLAARTADTAALNPGLSNGGAGWRDGPSPYADATDTKIAWLRAAAGDRFGALEIQASVLAGGITDDDPATVVGPVAAMLQSPVEHLIDSPHVLVGSAEQCIETVLGWRERWGISRLDFGAGIARDMAPVVSALAGA